MHVAMVLIFRDVLWSTKPREWFPIALKQVFFLVGLDRGLIVSCFPKVQFLLLANLLDMILMIVPAEECGAFLLFVLHGGSTHPYSLSAS